MELISLYVLFLVKMITIFIVIVAFIFIVFCVGKHQSNQSNKLQLINLGKKYKVIQKKMQLARLSQVEQKIWQKEIKKQEKIDKQLQKQKIKLGTNKELKPCLYVLDFKGSIDAHEVSSLREEISAILSVAIKQDIVLLRLESPGGVIHSYGLAASQLVRLQKSGIHLTVSVDKVAASGGYMMACVADRIISAPFAIIGSIGVVAQIPNFNRWLRKNNIDIELHTAGEFKRTLTLFGKNTEQGREKFQDELNTTHSLFKEFIKQRRPQLDIDVVATGEHWFGTVAKEKGLVDSIESSDEFLIAKMEHYEVISVKYSRHKRFIDRFANSVAKNTDRLLLRWWHRSEKPLL